MGFIQLVCYVNPVNEINERLIDHPSDGFFFCSVMDDIWRGNKVMSHWQCQLEQDLPYSAQQCRHTSKEDDEIFLVAGM